jgi:hypothetical protein
MIFWRFVDRLDYWFWDVRLRIVDAMYGPEAETLETEADQRRHRKDG